MDSDEAILNSCRVCRVSNQEGEFESLYNEEGELLSAAGQLYEELIGVQIESATSDFYPQYLCNSCDLQMKLFKKLKTKANKTLQDLKKLYEIVIKENILEDQQQDEEVGDLGFNIISQDAAIETVANTQDDEEEEEEGVYTEQQLIKVEAKCPQDAQEETSDETPPDSEIENLNEKVKDVPYIELLDVDYKLDAETLEYLDDLKSEILDNQQMDNKETQNKQTSNENSRDFIPVNFEESLPADDNLDTKSEFVETLEEASQGTVDNAEDNIFWDVYYLDEANDTENKLQRNYFCRTCDAQFNKRVDLQKHRKHTHLSKFPCAECAKVFQTSDALRVHQNLHRGLPAYQCELCKKTFNQKVHLTYHMAKHNNIRNFKCEICAKAFIAKGDLAIHMRCHTNERRYACDICLKEFLMHEHMKNHRFSHFEKKFECEICKQKFVSPSTLRTHTKSIHEDEPRFQCEYCVKKFRRKHHLEAHYKVHRKLRIIGVEEYEEAISNCEDDSILIVTED